MVSCLIISYCEVNEIIGYLIYRKIPAALTNSLQWRHIGRNGVWNHRPHHCLLNCLFSRRSKKTPRHWPLCGKSPGTGEFPPQMASNAENGFIWWRHHVSKSCGLFPGRINSWQASRQHCCQAACQILKRYDPLDTESRGSEIGWDLTLESSYRILKPALDFLSSLSQQIS